ncbi:DUF448 domain-containing protein [Novosphingobium sp. Gsoil 351]|uniref:DUF448 domain-containing protein n=1 Tax=Novosphingobium sp. Gsoil 351 TaxID=2675225 RepID=UPI0012B49425|nr:DUF448 domain-containing protein [Novosphingobium sp. Gsoil 351]QGN55419.1 DUF448 domain-containing protein [Novosphingobium sp. Gsoil 351]
MRTPHNEQVGSDIPVDPAERTCVLSGEKAARDALIRLAVSPEGEVFPDALAKAPGRGAWLGVSRGDLEIALAKGKFVGAMKRAFKGAPIAVAAELPAMIEAALSRAFTDRLGLELRAGKVLLGSDRIADNARAGKVAWIGHAADASEDGSRKLDQAWRVGENAEGTGRGGIRLPLDRAALSVALGRDNVVHLALTDAAAAARLAVPLGRLLRFLGHTTETASRDSARAGDLILNEGL